MRRGHGAPGAPESLAQAEPRGRSRDAGSYGGQSTGSKATETSSATSVSGAPTLT